jgi:hypothetical protein
VTQIETVFSERRVLLGGESSSTAGAYHLLTIVHVFTPHLSCFSTPLK